MVVKKSGIVRDIAAERIKILYALAKEAYKTDPELSAKYIKHIKKISKHYKISLSADFKKNVCKKCDAILIPGKSSSIRIASVKKYVVIKCLNCGSEMHVHF